jgi:hypothetical protein
MIEILRKLGRVGSKLGFTRALVLGPGWVLGRNFGPKLGFAEVYSHGNYDSSLSSIL